MEPPRKLMALSSRTTRNAANRHDRLGDLPDSLIHHIISLLGPNDIVSLSTLSTRLRIVCLSCPYLSLSSKCESPSYTSSRTSPSVSSSETSSSESDSECSSESDSESDSESISSVERASNYINKGKDISSECTVKCRQFRGFMDRILKSHKRKQINRLSLHWSCKVLDDSHKRSFDHWIRKVVKFNLHELDLNLGFKTYSDYYFTLPRGLYTSQSLSVLKLQLSNAFLRLPSESFSSLENLSLENVRIIPIVSFGNWVSTNCKSLKKLTLKNVTGMEKLRIKSSCLEHLEIYKGNQYHGGLCHLRISAKKLSFLYLKLLFDSKEENSILIYAPCLQSLTRIGTSVRYTCKGSFRSLQNGNINLECPRYHNSNSDDYVADFLRSVCWARVLHLNFGVIKTLSKQGHLPILFENLHHLVLEFYKSSEYEISVIASFLEGLPCLNSITIKYSRKSYDNWIHQSDNNTAEYEESQNLVVSQLREVEIELRSWEFGKGLVKYFLKHANKLEKLTIFYPLDDFHKLSSLDLHNLERASSTIGIFLVMKDFNK